MMPCSWIVHLMVSMKQASDYLPLRQHPQGRTHEQEEAHKAVQSF